MNNIKASFYDPAKLNNSVPEYFRQTKNFKGIDANIEYLFNDINAEWQIIGTWVDDISKIIDKKIIYLQQEPPECKLPSIDLLNHVKCAITPFHLNHPVKQYINSTPLPWTYDLNVLNCRKNGHTTTLASKLELNALNALKAGCNLVLHCNGNMNEMIKVAKVVPKIDNFTIKKTSHFYNFLI